MIDYLLRFDSESEAATVLGQVWADSALPVVLITADAVYGPPVDMTPVVVSQRETVPGFFLLVTEEGHPGQVAEIDRETGVIVSGDMNLAGARLDPAWAGAEPLLRSGE